MEVSDADLYGFDFESGVTAPAPAPAAPAPVAAAPVPPTGALLPAIPGLSGAPVAAPSWSVPAAVAPAAASATHADGSYAPDADVQDALDASANEFNVIVEDEVVEAIPEPERLRTGKFAPRWQTRYQYVRPQSHAQAQGAAPAQGAVSSAPDGAVAAAPPSYGDASGGSRPSASSSAARSVFDELGVAPPPLDTVLLPPEKRIIIFQIDPDSYPTRPWTHVGADTSLWFNYGLTVNTWRAYATRQMRVRAELEQMLEAYGNALPMPAPPAAAPPMAPLGRHGPPAFRHEHTHTHTHAPAQPPHAPPFASMPQPMPFHGGFPPPGAPRGPPSFAPPDAGSSGPAWRRTHTDAQPEPTPGTLHGVPQQALLHPSYDAASSDRLRPGAERRESEGLPSHPRDAVPAPVPYAPSAGSESEHGRSSSGDHHRYGNDQARHGDGRHRHASSYPSSGNRDYERRDRYDRDEPRRREEYDSYRRDDDRRGGYDRQRDDRYRGERSEPSRRRW